VSDIGDVLERMIRDDGWAAREGATIALPGGTSWLAYWYSGEMRHRDNGPASIERDRDGSIRLEWYRHGMRHRTDGPAVVDLAPGEVHIHTEWWIDDTLMSTDIA